MSSEKICLYFKKIKNKINHSSISLCLQIISSLSAKRPGSMLQGGSYRATLRGISQSNTHTEIDRITSSSHVIVLKSFYNSRKKSSD